MKHYIEVWNAAEGTWDDSPKTYQSLEAAANRASTDAGAFGYFACDYRGAGSRHYVAEIRRYERGTMRVLARVWR